MATIKQLQEKRENIKIQVLANFQDFREYIKAPVCSVDIDQIKYQIDYGLREIKEIDYKIEIILRSERDPLNVEFSTLKNQLDSKEFKSKDLPKKHYSMFNEPFL